MRRRPSPYQKFKKTLAPRLGKGITSHDFASWECRYMQKIFKHFPIEYHDHIAEYPKWLLDNRKKYGIEEAISQQERYEDMFKLMCSYGWIEHYLNLTLPS